ncbi:vomeronasal type-1 receptor 90-like [Ochotona curzoniae]|uniref:vomeronasal type-1 receptor 90-like n=1 Tax=Ochotona curzoniae TaxID=130825 RepID=UPI001B34B0F6|nr:vomeronasal type-1 receptor 90-like [Ochotona curzoniae]
MVFGHPRVLAQLTAGGTQLPGHWNPHPSVHVQCPLHHDGSQYHDSPEKRCRLRPVDLILRHLTVANCLVILSRGMTKIMEMLHWQHLNDNSACIIVFCMVFILYKHRKQVQHIHRNHHSPRPSAETRAAQSILIVVSTFVLCYALSSIIFVYIAVFDRPSSWLLNTAAIITSCFPTISPFVLLWRERNGHCLLYLMEFRCRDLGLVGYLIGCILTLNVLELDMGTG